MILVQDTFVCKPGNAGKLAKQFKEMMSYDKRVKYILTDMTGQWHRIIMVSEYDSLAAYEQSWEEMQNPTPEMQKAMEGFKNMNEMYVSGSREILKVW